MRNVLPFDEANIILSDYYKPVMGLLDKCIEDYNKLYSVFNDGFPVVYKGRTKGSFINDRLKMRMLDYFKNDSNVQVVEHRGIFGIIVADKLFIRFNKMDEKFVTAINKKTRQTRMFMRQAEIQGFPSNVTLLWGGYNPDLTWSNINGYYLVCYNDGIEWHYDMGRGVASQQLALNLQPQTEKSKKRRVTPKQKPGEQTKKTGTDNQ
ncbi:MAG: hypothetical protein JST82_16285 [Bacteroidetes bacterium]|nr:hypothetical protein [Bacteroidota bacterium]